MKKYIPIIKKYGIATVLVIIVSIIFIKISYTEQRNQIENNPTPTPVGQIANYKSIIPGVTSEKDLNNILGKPLETTKIDSQKINKYESTTGIRTHSAVIENGKTTFVKQVVSAEDNIISDSIISTYGIAPYKLYERYPNSVFMLHIYPTNGIAYLGADDGTIKEIWYFPSTDFKNFKILYASDFLEQKPDPIR